MHAESRANFLFQLSPTANGEKHARGSEYTLFLAPVLGRVGDEEEEARWPKFADMFGGMVLPRAATTPQHGGSGVQ